MNPHPSANRSSEGLSSSSVPPPSYSSFRPFQSVTMAFRAPTPSQVLGFKLLPHGLLPVIRPSDQSETFNVGSVPISDVGDGVRSQFCEDTISHDMDAEYQPRVVLRRPDATESVQSPSLEQEMEVVSSWLSFEFNEEYLDDIVSPQLPLAVDDQAPDFNSVSPPGVGNRCNIAPQFVDSLSKNNRMLMEPVFGSGSSSTSQIPYANISTSSLSGGNHAGKSVLSITDTGHSSRRGAIVSSPPRHYSGLPSYIHAAGTASLPGVHEVTDEHWHGGILQFNVKSEVLNLNDGFIWYKYGEKKIKNREFPRSYFRCAQTGCHVQKQLERSSEKPEVVLVRYKGKHNHPA